MSIRFGFGSLASSEGSVNDWDDVPENIKRTFDKLGIPEAEQKFLAGVTAQYESEVVYHRNREDLEELVTKLGAIEDLKKSAQANLEISTPAINSIRASMTARHAQLEPFYTSGAVGLTDQGLVALRDAKVLSLQDRPTANRLVADDLPVTESWIAEEELDANPGLVKTMSVQPPRGAGRIPPAQAGLRQADPAIRIAGTQLRVLAERGDLLLPAALVPSPARAGIHPAFTDRFRLQHDTDGNGQGLAVVALGGYGRGEVNPHSDVDVMVLFPDGAEERADAFAGPLLAFLWDLGFEVGHATRSPSETSAPASLRTIRIGRSSHFGSGTPTTAASATSGCAMMLFSRSTELIHSPPDLMTSLARSDIWMKPLGSTEATSPVLSHPSWNFSSVGSL